jgi:hypothetical protein
MRRPLAAVLACTLLLACGDDPRVEEGCTVAVRGAITADLPCVVRALRAGVADQESWQLHLEAYTGATRSGPADVDVFLVGPGAPFAQTAYGLGPGTQAVPVADATRSTDVTSFAARAAAITHDASEPGGALSLTVTAFPPAATEGGAHGTVRGTLPAIDGGSPITIEAQF